MKDKFELGYKPAYKPAVEKDISQYQQLLELSSNNLKPAIKAQLNEKRRFAIDSMEADSGSKILNWRPALALSLPVILIAVVMYLPLITEQEQESTDIYADLEILMDEEQLDFLSEMEVSEWMVAENGG